MPNLPASHNTPLRTLPDKPNLTAIEVARYLSVSLGHIYALVKAGEIPHHRVGGLIRFNRLEFLAWYNRPSDNFSE